MDIINSYDKPTIIEIIGGLESFLKDMKASENLTSYQMQISDLIEPKSAHDYGIVYFTLKIWGFPNKEQKQFGETPFLNFVLGTRGRPTDIQRLVDLAKYWVEQNYKAIDERPNLNTPTH